MLALLTGLSGSVPPFQLAALSFAIAFIAANVVWLARGQSPFQHLKQPIVAWAVGVGGLFGYHFFYFLALRNAPLVEAGLIAYLWPLLIVVFSGLLPGGGLRWWHLTGVLAGLVGTVLLVTDGGTVTFKAKYTLGYSAAAVCALTWSAYSVISSRLAHVPTDAVGGFCGATAVLAACAHLAFEETVWPAGTTSAAASTRCPSRPSTRACRPCRGRRTTSTSRPPSTTTPARRSRMPESRSGTTAS